MRQPVAPFFLRVPDAVAAVNKDVLEMGSGYAQRISQQLLDPCRAAWEASRARFDGVEMRVAEELMLAEGDSTTGILGDLSIRDVVLAEDKDDPIIRYEGPSIVAELRTFGKNQVLEGLSYVAVSAYTLKSTGQRRANSPHRALFVRTDANRDQLGDWRYRSHLINYPYSS